MRSLVLMLLVLGIALATRAAPAEPRFRTGPSRADPEVIARGWLASQRASLGFEAEDLEDLALAGRRASRRGHTNLWLQQRHLGLEVHGAILAATTSTDGRLAVTGDRLVRGAGARSAAARAWRLDASAAVARAAQALGEPLDPFDARLPARRVWFPTAAGALRPGWRLVLRTRDGRHVWSVVVDAGDGALLFANDWVARDSYLVFAPPLVNPDEGARSSVANPADPSASPFGWHDHDLAPGADANDSNGFAAIAQEDVAGDDVGEFAPGGPSRSFEFVLDTTRDPLGHLSASITQAFFVTSWLHDVLWRYGFDAASGNFERASPTAGDPVIVDVQDGDGTDNAQFLFAVDGVPGRLELFIWDDARLTVSAPPAIAGVYQAGRARFGPMLTPQGVTGEIVQALDASNTAGPTPTDGCSPFANAAEVAGRIAFVDRGSCLFVEKVANAEAAGAVAVVVADNPASPATAIMGGDDTGQTIPSLLVTVTDGNSIRAQLGAGVSGTASGYTRDSALDSGIVIHEYAHGLTTRLTGGPQTVDCLSGVQSVGLGEGWSDFLALALTQDIGDTRTLARGIGTYVRGQPPNGLGIRAYRYSTNMAVNPRRYGHVALTTSPHANGEIWAAALWELWWGLVEPYGFDPAFGAGDAGSDRALELVIEALAAQVCNPTYLNARDALLFVDENLYAQRHRCRIWNAMAKRGMGVSAYDGGGSASQAIVEAFDLPAECRRCGDVDDDTSLTLADLVRARRAQAELDPRLVAPEKCNLSGPVALGDGDGDGVLDDCTGADAALLREVLSGLVPAAPDVCAPALGQFR